MSTQDAVRQSSPRPRRAAGSDAVSAMRRRVMRGGLVLVLVLALADGVFGARGLIENMQLRQRNAALESAIEQMDTGNAGLIEEIRRLREDPAAIEELARGELELMKEGELLIILRDAPAPARGSAKAASPSAASR